MKTAAAFVVLSAAMALSACGSSQPASQGATADTVELPAEEAMAGTSAMPSEMVTDLPTVVASDEGMDTSAGGSVGAVQPATGGVPDR